MKELDDKEIIWTVERKGYCKIGYTQKDLEKIAFYFQNTSLIRTIIVWLKFNYRNRKAYE